MNHIAVHSRLADALSVLNDRRVRATYRALGEYLGLSAIQLGKVLGMRRPETSWIVRSDSGLPTGYTAHQVHPDLTSNALIIRSGNQLEAFVELIEPA